MRCAHFTCHQCPDPRDAEIARLKAEVERLTARITDHEDDRAAVLSERCATDEHHCACVPVLRADLAAHKRAIAAGPERLRRLRSDDYSPGYVAGLVEAAQAAAMKEKP